MKATLEVEISSPSLVKRAIGIEKPKNDRVVESISTEKGKLKLKIESDDLKSLKAALNSNMTWLEVAGKFGGK